MIWKIIGQSVIGSSHVQSGKGCEDAINYQSFKIDESNEALIVFISDGAGSAKYAALASVIAVQKSSSIIEEWLNKGLEIEEIHLLQLVETVYDHLSECALQKQVPINEFSCTLLGAVLLPHKACFLQIGDGAIIRNDGSGYFTYIWWPQNGEYQNTTTFLIDDPNFKNLKTKIIEEHVEEIAVFTDGLQMLGLNYESQSVHQPFFNNLIKILRQANNPEHLSILNNKLINYLSGDIINDKTDDDKTLLLATKLKYDSSNL